MQIKQTMLITACSWENGRYETFQLIPIAQDCPFTKVFYDPVGKLLVLLSRDQKEHFTLLEKLTEFGYPARKNNKALMDRQRTVSFTEHYVHQPKEIAQLVQLLAVNADVYDFTRYMDELVEFPKKSHLHVAADNDFSTADLYPSF